MLSSCTGWNHYLYFNIWKAVFLKFPNCPSKNIRKWNKVEITLNRLKCFFVLLNSKKKKKSDPKWCWRLQLCNIYLTVYYCVGWPYTFIYSIKCAYQDINPHCFGKSKFYVSWRKSSDISWGLNCWL